MMKILKAVSVLMTATLAITLLIFAPLKTFADQTVNVPNSGFEETTIQGRYKVPKSWNIITGSNIFLSFSSDVAVSGQSVRFSDGTIISLESSEYVAITSGYYTFGYKCVAEAANVLATVAVKTYDENELFIAEHKSDGVNVTTDGWQDVSITLNLSEEVKFIKLILTVDTAQSACYLDDAFVTTAEEPLPDLKLTTLSGASLRLVTNSAGIRFRGTVDKIAYDKYKEKFENVSVGILFTVEENLVGLEDFTVETLAANSKVYKEITAEKWNNPDLADTDGYYGFNCAIVDIKAVNISKSYCARTYLKYDKDGQTVYLYGNFTLSDNSRSVKNIALIAMEDLDSYAPEQVEIIEYFANFSYEE